MITTVTLNPCNDKTVEIPAFVYGGMNRILSIRYDYSGKGFNVSRGCVRLGVASTAVGFLYTDNGNAVADMLQSEGVQVDCVWDKGSVRTNTKVVDLQKLVVTELNEGGNPASPALLAQALDKVEQYAKQSDYMVLSGSLPPDAPQDTYARMVEKCKPYCKVLLDAEGEKLVLGIEQAPNIIKPNLFELETALGRPLPTQADIVDACRRILQKGVELVVVSLGGDGAIAVSRQEAYFAPPVQELQIRSTVGAGDSMVAGLCVALSLGHELKTAFAWAVAAGSACCENEGTELVTKKGLDAMLHRIEIRKL